MTREDFINAYATRSGLTSKAAGIGLLSSGDRDGRMIALPCACGGEDCEGWAMVGIEQVLHHLFFDAPEDMVSAYRAALNERGQVMP